MHTTQLNKNKKRRRAYWQPNQINLNIFGYYGVLKYFCYEKY